MKHWKKVPTFLALALTIITWIIALAPLFQSGFSMGIYYGGVFYYSGGYVFDVPYVITAFLAGLVLIGTFITGKPQSMYRGLQAYIWLVGLMFCYIFSANGRIMVLGIPLLPNFYAPAIMVILLLTIIVLLLLRLVQVPVLRALAFISGTKGRQEKMRRWKEQPHSYQAGYQAYSPDNRERPSLYKRISGSVAPNVSSYEQFEQPQTMYPQLPEIEM